MRTKFLIPIVGAIIVIGCLVGFFLLTEKEEIPKELKLSDYPEIFKENTVIIIGDNASQIEKESAEAIAANLENLTGNKPEIINTKKSKVLNVSSYLNFYRCFKFR